MSTPDRILGIFLVLLVTALGFVWGWVTRAIYDKEKKTVSE